jgi:DNA (cytosine-5)-methyltransferase 1
VLNAADFGIPQLRYRFFLAALRDGRGFVFPRPTHAAPGGGREGGVVPAAGLPPYSAAWEALDGIRPDDGERLAIGGKWAGLLPSIPEGENCLWHTDRKGGLPLSAGAPAT